MTRIIIGSGLNCVDAVMFLRCVAGFVQDIERQKSKDGVQLMKKH